MEVSRGTARIARLMASAAAASVLAMSAVPACAQDNAEVRLNKVEAEVRALQRKVFPGADGKYFEPEITPTAKPAGAPGQPSTTPVTDLLARMDAVEGQMARLTAQIEQNTNRIGQLEAKLASGMPPAATLPAQSVPAAGSTPGLATGATPGTAQGTAPAAATAAQTATTPRPAATNTPPAASTPTIAAPPARVAAVQAIVKPQTNDAGDDEYSYGFRLWEAKFYPEAEQQLKLFLEKYPRHARASWGRNLLGRAYLDDGNPGEAAKWFLQNYQADKRGDRAPDSLLYLAGTMKQMKDTKRACIALAEFSETYASEAAGRLKALYDATRSGLSCS